MRFWRTLGSNVRWICASRTAILSSLPSERGGLVLWSIFSHAFAANAAGSVSGGAPGCFLEHGIRAKRHRVSRAEVGDQLDVRRQSEDLLDGGLVQNAHPADADA